MNKWISHGAWNIVVDNGGSWSQKALRSTGLNQKRDALHLSEKP